MGIPSTLTNHPKVADVEDFRELDPYWGMQDDMEPRYLVHLKKDWQFDKYYSASRSFRTVTDFLNARIIPR